MGGTAALLMLTSDILNAPNRILDHDCACMQDFRKPFAPMVLPPGMLPAGVDHFARLHRRISSRMNPMLVSSRLDLSPASWGAAPPPPGASGATVTWASVDVEESRGMSVQRLERLTSGT